MPAWPTRLPLLFLLAGCPKSGDLALSDLPVAPAETAAIDPAQVLLEQAASEDPVTRGRALALLLAHEAEPGGGRLAQRALWDPSAWVQDHAVEALSERLDEPETVTVLQAYLGRASADAHARATAAAALAQAGHTGLAVPWKDEPDLWLRTPLLFAAAVQGDAEALPPLQKALSRALVSMELHFLLLLGSSGLELTESLRIGAEIVEPELGLSWAGARLAAGDDDARDLLHAALASKDPFARLEALDVLDGVPGTDDLVRQALGQDDEVGLYAGMILLTRGAEGLERLELAMASDRREAREQAMRLLPRVPAESRKDRKRLRAALRLGLSDEDATVRAYALRALGQLGFEGEEAWARAGLADDYAAVRVEAAGALLAAPGE